MKKLFLLATCAVLLSGSSFAHNGGDKGKKKKTSSMHNCPGKECGKKKS